MQGKVNLMMGSIKTYSELITIPTFLGRYEYLKVSGIVGDVTFGGKRYLNQILYKTDRWASLRNEIIIRDNGCDLGIIGREIFSRLTVHHINPITIYDVVDHNPIVFDPENLISTADMTHKAIHYGDTNLLTHDPTMRYAHDTCPWKK